MGENVGGKTCNKWSKRSGVKPRTGCSGCLRISGSKEDKSQTFCITTTVFPQSWSKGGSQEASLHLTWNNSIFKCSLYFIQWRNKRCIQALFTCADPTAGGSYSWLQQAPQHWLRSDPAHNDPSLIPGAQIWHLRGVFVFYLKARSNHLVTQELNCSTA